MIKMVVTQFNNGGLCNVISFSNSSPGDPSWPCIYATALCIGVECEATSSPAALER